MLAVCKRGSQVETVLLISLERRIVRISSTEAGSGLEHQTANGRVPSLSALLEDVRCKDERNVHQTAVSQRSNVTC